MPSVETIILIDRARIQFYIGGKVYSLAIPETSVKDLEVINEEAYASDVSTYLEKYKLTPGTTMILLSEAVCFISEPILKNKLPKDALEEFTGSIPFENPATRILGDKVVGTNKDLYQIVVDVIGRKEGRLRTVAPIFIAKEMVGKRQLNDVVVQYVLKNEVAFVNATFSYEAVLPTRKPKEPGRKLKFGSFKILMAVFFILSIILVWVIVAL